MLLPSISAEKLHADDTPVPVLAPGLGKTKLGRLWTYVRDDRPRETRHRQQCGSRKVRIARANIPRRRFPIGSARCRAQSYNTVQLTIVSARPPVVHDDGSIEHAGEDMQNLSALVPGRELCSHFLHTD